jgi:hypothetical protein
MSLENPLGLARTSKVESPETKKALDMFRGKLLGAMALGYTAFLEACGGQITKEDIEKMPTTSMQDVIKDPKSFANMPIVKIEGYPVMVTKENTQIPIPVFETVNGKMNLVRFDWISKEVDCYDVHQTSDLNSPSLKACAEGDISYFPYVPVNLNQPEKIAPHFSDVVGRVEEWGFGKGKHYVLSIKAAAEKKDQW